MKSFGVAKVRVIATSAPAIGLPLLSVTMPRTLPVEEFWADSSRLPSTNTKTILCILMSFSLSNRFCPKPRMGNKEPLENRHRRAPLKQHWKRLEGLNYLLTYRIGGLSRSESAFRTASHK